jgi:coenzyme F420-reducing hydrogenase beta subunit
MMGGQDESTLHIGKDGFSITGRDAIIVGLLAVSLAGLGVIFYRHLESDQETSATLLSNSSEMRQEHTTLKHSIDENTKALNRVGDEMGLQSYLMIATPEQEKEARAIIGRPRLLQR